MLDSEEYYDKRKYTKRIRVRVITNRGLRFITAIRIDATVSELANKILSVYLQLSGDLSQCPSTKKQLTVSAVRQGIFYMPKSELVSNILSNDDEVEVDIIKAKPKYPNQIFKQTCMRKEQIESNQEFLKRQERRLELKKKIEDIEQKKLLEMENNSLDNFFLNTIDGSKREKKRDKKKQKQEKILAKMQRQRAILQNAMVQQKSIVLIQQQKPIMSQSLKKSQYPSQTKIPRQKDKLYEDVIKKKIKFDEEIENYHQKNSFIPIPSPKITFHSDPRIQSPKFSLIGQSSKRKEQAKRKISEDADMRKPEVSPMIAYKSPSIKTPLQLNPIMENYRQKEKDQLFNFSLTHKKPEDKKVQPKKQVPPKKVNDQNKQIIEHKQKDNNLTSKDSLQKLQSTQKLKLDDITSEQNKPKQKPMKNLIIVEPQSDSDSQESKRITNNPIPIYRQKQLAQINKKISNFMIQSQSDEQ